MLTDVRELQNMRLNFPRKFLLHIQHLISSNDTLAYSLSERLKNNQSFEAINASTQR